MQKKSSWCEHFSLPENKQKSGKLNQEPRRLSIISMASERLNKRAGRVFVLCVCLAERVLQSIDLHTDLACQVNTAQGQIISEAR